MRIMKTVAVFAGAIAKNLNVLRTAQSAQNVGNAAHHALLALNAPLARRALHALTHPATVTAVTAAHSLFENSAQ